MIKKAIAAILAAAITAPVFAQDFCCGINAVDMKVYVTAKASDQIEGKYYNIILLKPGKSLDEMNADNINEFEHYIFQGESGVDGDISYEFNLREDSPSGYYTAYMTIEGEDTEYVDGIYYASAEDADALAFLIDNPEGETDLEKAEYIKGLLENELNRKMLNMDETFFDRLQDKGAVYTMLSRADFSGTREGFNGAADEIIFVCALNQGCNAGETMEYYAPRLGFAETHVYKKYIDYDKKNSITLNGFGFLNKERALKQLSFELIMSRLNNILRWEDAIDILKEFSAETGISFERYNAVKNKYGAVTEFLKSPKKDLEDIKTVFDNVVSKYQISQSEGGGGGGGGGSKPSISNGVSVTPSVQLENTKNSPNENDPLSGDKAVFYDMAGHWAENAVKLLVSKDIAAGYEDNSFRPEENITREEFVKLLVIAFKIPSSEEAPEFSDISSDRWSREYISGAAKAGIVFGNDRNEFEPLKKITRQEMCAMAGRCLEYKNISLQPGETAQFSDFSEIAPFAKKYVAGFADAGIVNGVGEGRFAPNDNSTRAMAAKIIFEILNRTEG